MTTGLRQPIKVNICFSLTSPGVPPGRDLLTADVLNFRTRPERRVEIISVLFCHRFTNKFNNVKLFLTTRNELPRRFLLLLDASRPLPFNRF